MSRYLVFGFMLILILVSGCQPAVNANVVDEGVLALRLVTTSEGYYQISSQEMWSAGLSVASADEIQLIFEGETYPFRGIESSGESEFNILFYAPPAGRYLTEQVFILQKMTTGAVSTKLSELEIRPEVQSGSNQNVTFRKLLEPQQIYLSPAGMDDPWLWQNMDPRDGIQLSIVLDGEDLTGHLLELEFWSPTNAPTNPDHAVQAWLNGFDLGVYEWEGAGWKSIEIPLKALSLENENVLQLEMVALNDVIVQKTYLDRVMIEGQMFFTPGDQPVTFYGDESEVQIEKPSSEGCLTELDSTNGSLRTAEINQETGFAFETVNGARYDWLPDNGYRKVERVEAINWSSDLTAAETSVDWLVIAPSQYQAVLQPLITQRNSQGLQTLVVDAQQIYDQFNGGSPTPQALSRFFKTVKTNWQKFPEYVLLIGDFTTNHQTYEQAISNMPSYFVESAFAGETASDLPLMDLDGDNLPDFVIGRIPVDNIRQLKNWVDKLVKYESSETRSGIDQIIAIADNQDGSFGEAATDFLANFSNGSETYLLQPEGDQETAAETIRSFFDESTDLLAYFGHGSIDIWGKEYLFSVENVTQLGQNEMVPIIINLSCLTGYYIHPQNSSMAEALLFQEGGGSVAVIAPTSLTFQTYQTGLSTVLSNELQSDKNQKLGDIIKPAWRSMDPENSSSLEVMQTFLLFGDPAMTIHP